jgi:sugar lactone lactonase YvrE
MHMGEPRQPLATFYRLDPDLSLTAWRSGIYTTNGLAFSPDGRTMYFSDSFAEVRTIWSAPYDTDTGVPGAPSVFFDTRAVAGRPDGATVDADGCYWMAGVTGWQLVRLTPRGTVDMIVTMPVSRPSKPMFGGADLSTLYVTSIGEGGPDEPLAGGLFAVTGLPTGGLPEQRFAG